MVTMLTILHLYWLLQACDTMNVERVLITAKESAMNINSQTHKLELLLKKHQLLTLNEAQPKMADRVQSRASFG